MIRSGSLSPFDNIHSGSLGPFDINPPWFAWFLLLIYESLVPLVPLIIYGSLVHPLMYPILYEGSLVPLIIFWFAWFL